MIMTSIIVSVIFTIIILVLTLVTISRGYGYKHTVDPIKKGEKVREFTGNGERL